MITIASSLLDNIEQKIVDTLNAHAEIPANNKDQCLRDITAIRVLFHYLRIEMGLK